MTAKTKQPSARAAKLARLKTAGYHADNAAFTREYLSGVKVSMTVARQCWNDGVKAKLAGVPCNCSACTQARETKS